MRIGQNRLNPMDKLLPLSVAIGSSVALHPGVGVLTAEPSSRPNVVLILVDDLGWMDLNSYAEYATGTLGNEQFYKTPHLNQLASEAVSFMRGYSAPLCTPSRAALLSGRNGATFGFNNAAGMRAKDFTFAARNTTPPEGYLLHDRIPETALRFPVAVASGNYALPNGSPASGGVKVYSIAELLPDYRSAFIGKWHVGGGDIEGHRPQDFGFEVIAYEDEGWSGYFNNARWRWHYPGPPVMAEYLTDDLTKVSIDWIRRHVSERPDEPFLFLLSHFAVHDPFEAKADDIAYFEGRETRGWNNQTNAVYAAMIRSLDDSVGAIREALEDVGIADNTIVVFVSDNGAMARKGDIHVTSNLPLRGHKAQVFEGGIRVPFIMHVPDRQRPGSRVHTPVALEDLAPTLVALTGQDVPEEIREQWTGLSLVPLLEERPADFPQRTLFVHEPYYRPDALTGGVSWMTPATAAIEGDWKLVAFHHGEMMLFNLSDDPGEQNDLSSLMPERVSNMRRRVMQWRRENIPVRYDTRRNPDYNPQAPNAFPIPEGDLFVR